MIDPNNITNYARTDDELLEFWLFCLFVRGKNAMVQARKLAEFTDGLQSFKHLYYYPDFEIERRLRLVKSGQYGTLARAICGTLKRGRGFLERATVAELESIPGVGPKTARFFICHSRASARVAVLDTHIIRFMATQVSYPVGKGTPTSKQRYARIEQDFLAIADKAGVSPAALDLAVWKAARSGDPQMWRAFL